MGGGNGLCQPFSPLPELGEGLGVRAVLLESLEQGEERGLLLLKAGVYGNAIRVLCPLVLTDAELDEALGVWEDALAHVLA